MVGGGCPLLREILGQTDPPSFKNGDFHSIFTRSGSTVGASERSSIMTNRSSVRPLQGAEDEQATLPLRRQFCRFRIKRVLRSLFV